MKQMAFRSLTLKQGHGGEFTRGKRKAARPLVTKRPMHFVLRAECARGSMSLLSKRNAVFIRSQLKVLAARWEVRVMETANVSNHLHLLVQGATRDGLKNFIRRLSGSIAQFVTGAKKGHAFGKRFWDHLVYSRVVTWGKDLKGVIRYIEGNRKEAVSILKSSVGGSRKAVWPPHDQFELCSLC